MSSVNKRHTWTLQGINISPAILRPYYRGFVVRPPLLIHLDNFTISQGTEILGDREVRSSFLSVTDGAPQRQVVQSIIKYTGTLSIPEWMDIERGSVLIFSDFAKGTQVK